MMKAGSTFTKLFISKEHLTKYFINLKEADGGWSKKCKKSQIKDASLFDIAKILTGALYVIAT